MHIDTGMVASFARFVAHLEHHETSNAILALDVDSA